MIYNESFVRTFFIQNHVRTMCLPVPFDNSTNELHNYYITNHDWRTNTGEGQCSEVSRFIPLSRQVNLMKHVQVVNHSAHPHVQPDGTVYNLGQSVGLTGPAYNVIKFTPSDGSG